MLSTITEDELLGYLTSLSNWGRWGPDDQLGTLNYLGPEATRRGVATVTEGQTVSCSRPLSPRGSAGRPPSVLHFMTLTGNDSPTTGKGISADWIGLAIHGTQLTHLDAPSHEAWDRRLYNDRDASLVSNAGARWCSAELAADRLAGRGVLLDIPRFKGVGWLGAGEQITPADLAECARAQGIEFAEGDIVIIRTGRDARAAEAGDFDLARDGTAGLSPRTLPWLRDNRVSVLVSDAYHDPQPHLFASMDKPIHCIGLRAMGLWLVDNAYVEQLAARCAELTRWSFLFVVGSLPIRRSTGSPVNPVAIL